VVAPAAQAPSQVPAELEEAVRAAMKRAYNLGQTYWQQADSEYTSQHKKADVTAGRFIELTDEICSKVRLSAVREARNEALDAARYRFLRSKMCFSGGKDVGATMTMLARVPAPDHNFHTDWVGDRFDASVDATVDRAMAAAAAEDGDEVESPAASKEGGNRE
jgi:hypothetical protein